MIHDTQHELLHSPENIDTVLAALQTPGLPVIAYGTSGQLTGGITTGSVESNGPYYEFHLGEQIGLYKPAATNVYVGGDQVAEFVRGKLQFPEVTSPTIMDVAKSIELLCAMDDSWQFLQNVYSSLEQEAISGQAYEMFGALMVHNAWPSPSLLPARVVKAFSVVQGTNKFVAASQLQLLVEQRLIGLEGNLPELHVRKIKHRYEAAERIAQHGRRPLAKRRAEVDNFFNKLIEPDQAL